MKVKRYLVKDMNEAMIKIKSELGMDAVILNTRKIKTGGLFKFFKKPLIEVVAAIDEPLINTYSKPSEVERKGKVDSEVFIKRPEPKPEFSGNASQYVPIHEEPNWQASMGYSKSQERVQTQPNFTNEVQNSNMNSEVLELKQMVTELIRKVETIEHKEMPTAQQKENPYVEILKGLDIQESIAKKIIDIVQRQISLNDKNHDAILNAMKVITKEYLGDIRTIDTDLINRPNIYLFLGPTGVGKTTTLAKIAARLSLIENKKVGLITADTYRIAAVEQLKTYSEILGIPLEVIYEAGELEEALAKFKDKDYILIDTAGRSHKSKELKSDFDELVKYLSDVQIFLVMSMTTSFKDMKSIIESYGFLKDYRLLFTKLDEATSYGNILNIKVLTGKALSYFAIGQSVPDDIEVADKDKIVNYIFDNNQDN